jgi:hypothetical protein
MLQVSILSLKKFYYRKRHVTMQKSKKRKEKREKKEEKV